MRSKLETSAAGGASRAALPGGKRQGRRIIPAGIVIHCRFKERRGGRSLRRRP